MKKWFIALLLVVSAIQLITAQHSKFIQINNTTKQFIDSTGRSRIFHGVNSVYKVAPWHPELNSFNTRNSLSQTDMIYLKEWGFTVLRLGVMWPGVSISENQFNHTYLQVMKQLVDDLGSHGIYTVIDCHQDLFSRFYCGEGAPDWVVEKITAKTRQFPIPVSDPSSLSYDPSTGYPNISSCLQTPFFDYYKAAAVGEAFQALYDNQDGIQDAFISYWEQVALTFKDSPYLLAYELLNEPWAGNIYRHPKSRFIPGYADRTYLFPMYQLINDAIRKYDEEHIVMFEAAISNKGECGFPGGPGGPGYDDRQAYSYHVYCGSSDDNGDPTRPSICNLSDLLIFDIKEADYQKMGLAAMITEFGALEGTPSGVSLLNNITQRADETLQSWIYWQYKFNADLTTQSATGAESFWINATLDFPKVKALSRTYAHAVAGIPTYQFFDPLSGFYQLNFTIGGDDIALTSNITEIYINTEYYYPLGYEISYSRGLIQLPSSLPYIIQISNYDASGNVTIMLFAKLNNDDLKNQRSHHTADDAAI